MISVCRAPEVNLRMRKIAYKICWRVLIANVTDQWLTMKILKGCLLSLLAIQALQNALALQRRELFQLAEFEHFLLPEADDTSAEVFLVPPFVFYGNTYNDYFVSCFK